MNTKRSLHLRAVLTFTSKVHTYLLISPVRIVAVLPRSQRYRRRLAAFLHLDVSNPLAAHGLQMVEQVEPKTSHDVSVALLEVEGEKGKMTSSRFKFERTKGTLHRCYEAGACYGNTHVDFKSVRRSE